MPEYAHAPEVAEIAARLIPELLEELLMANIVYLYRHPAARS